MNTETTVPIATLTLNPCLDVSYEFRSLVADQKVYADHNRFDPGGNGINVGRALKLLDQATTNCCFLAGNIGNLIQRLLEPQIDGLNAVRLEGETRINCVLLEKEPATQFEVNGIGPTVTNEDLERITASVLAAAADGFAVLTGSLPPGTPETVYGDLTEQLHKRGARAVIDTQGEKLKHALIHKPFLVKPNRYELELHCGHPLPRLEDVVEEARRIQQDGVTYVCVSLGADGAVLVGPDNCYRASSPDVPVRSTVGAGDSMVGGLVAGFSQGRDAMETLRLAICCGSGTAGKPGTQLFTREDVAKLEEQVEICALDL